MQFVKIMDLAEIPQGQGFREEISPETGTSTNPLENRRKSLPSKPPSLEKLRMDIPKIDPMAEIGGPMNHNR